MIKRTSFLMTFTSVVLSFLQACGSGNTTDVSNGKQVEMKYATNLSIEEFEGYTIANIRNPWDTTKLLASYILLEDGTQRPAGYPEGQVINVPLERSVVYSAVHNSLIAELGAAKAISGVCDAEYIYTPDLKKRIENRDIADCGNNTAPNVEQILRLSPGAVLLSPYENSNGHGKLDHAGIPIVECADYMETTPLGRLEWVKFYGRLYGVEKSADSLFSVNEKEYLALKESVERLEDRPKVLIDRVYGQIWYMPSKNSTFGRLIEDAGGINPFGDVEGTGSLSLSPEKVLMKAGDADVWLIRYSHENMNMENLARDKELYTKFKAYRDGRVYGSDAEQSNIFEDQSFHPHLILADLISIFHPELSSFRGDGKRYFEKLK